MKAYKVTFVVDSELNEVETLIHIEAQLESFLPFEIRDVEVEEVGE
jgi:hypothetical protein